MACRVFSTVTFTEAITPNRQLLLNSNTGTIFKHKTTYRGKQQFIIWQTAGLLSPEHMGTNSGEIWMKIKKYLCTKIVSNVVYKMVIILFRLHVLNQVFYFLYLIADCKI